MTSPTITADRQPDLETAVTNMAKIGSCHSPSFFPDGSRVALISDLTGVPQVWIVPVSAGWPELITALDDPVQSVAWSPEGSWLAFAAAPGGGMNGQVFVVRPDGSDLHQLTDGGKENNWLGPWTHDGRQLALSSNRRRPDAADVFLFEPPDGEPRLVGTGEGTSFVTAISRDGQHAIVARRVQRGDSNLNLLDLTTGRETCLTPHEGPGRFEGGAFAPDGSTIYLVSDLDRDLAAFARLRLGDNGEPGPIEVLAARDDAEIQAFALTEDGTTAALVWNLAGRSTLAFFDTASRTVTSVPELPAEIVLDTTFSQAGQLLALTLEGSDRPADIWVLDRTTGDLKQVTRSPHAGVDLDFLVQPELIRFSAEDGLELSGWLYQPRNLSEPCPLVISFHGGPEGQSRPIFNSTYQALVGQGIAVLAPNVRGSSGFGKRFVNLDNGPLRANAIRDIKACVDAAIRTGAADPRRIGIMGGSYGGYMTMAGLTEYPEIFAAGANLFGVVNFETFFAHTEPWMAAISKVEYGDPETQRDLLRDLSPIHKIDQVWAPTIVLHGANDTNVPVVEAEQVVEALTRRGVPVDYVLFPDEGHGFVKTTNRIRATVAIVRWFVEHLGSQGDRRT